MTTGIGNLGGALKKIYGKYTVAVPAVSKLQMLAPFNQRNKTGDTFDENVRLRNENGVTVYSEGTIPTLKGARSMSTGAIVVPGSNLVLRSQLTYEAAAKATEGRAAFFNATREQMKSGMESARNRIEIMNLYGRSPNGIAGYTATPTGLTATTASFVVPEEQWADGIWAVMEDALIEFRENAAPGTRVGGAADGEFTVTSVDPATFTVTVTGTAAGITALTGAAGAHSVFFSDQYDVESYGIDAIIQNTGVLFGIDASVNSLWKANTETISGAPTVEGVNLALAPAAMRSTVEEDVDIFVNQYVWNLILNAQAGLRRYPEIERTYANGARAIEFHSSNGVQRYHGHKFVKRGDIFALPTQDNLVRIGGQDLSFNRPGFGDDQIVRELDDQPAFEVRLYTNQAIFLRRPAACTKITGYTL